MDWEGEVSCGVSSRRGGEGLLWGSCPRAPNKDAGDASLPAPRPGWRGQRGSCCLDVRHRSSSWVSLTSCVDAVLTRDR